MPLRMPCPACGCDHLHASVYVDAESGDRFEVVAPGDEPATVVAKEDPQGRLVRPEEAHLLCCACGWETDHVIRWAEPP